MVNATIYNQGVFNQFKTQIIHVNLPILAQNSCPFNPVLQHPDIARKLLLLELILCFF